MTNHFLASFCNEVCYLDNYGYDMKGMLRKFPFVRRQEDVNCLIEFEDLVLDGGEDGLICNVLDDSVLGEREGSVLCFSEYDGGVVDGGEYGIYDSLTNKKISGVSVSSLVEDHGFLLGANGNKVVNVFNWHIVGEAPGKIEDLSCLDNGLYAAWNSQNNGSLRGELFDVSSDESKKLACYGKFYKFAKGFDGLNAVLLISSFRAGETYAICDLVKGKHDPVKFSILSYPGEKFGDLVSISDENFEKLRRKK